MQVQKFVTLRRSLLTVAFASLMALASVQIAQAATIPVGGTCSLVDAINSANTDTSVGTCPAGSGDDFITLPAATTLSFTAVDNNTDGPNALPSITSTVVISGNGAILARPGTAPDLRLLHIATPGVVTIYKLTIQGGNLATDGGGCLYVSSAKLTLLDTFLETCAAKNGGALAVAGGTVAIGSGSIITGNLASDNGGGIFVTPATTSTVVVDNGHVLSNTAGINGGGIFVGASSTFIMQGGSQVNENIATTNGGGIYLESSTNSTLNASEVVANSNVGGSGGGIFSDDGLALTNMLVLSNTSASNGGGAYVLAGAVVISNTNFVSNTALAGTGGGLGATPPISLSDGMFVGNSATGDGGAVYAGNGIALMGARFISNTSGANGGAIAAYNDTTTITNGYFEQNAGIGGSSEGGAVAFDAYTATLLIQDTDFLSNTAAFYSGALYNDFSAGTRIIGGRFQGNSSATTGAAIKSDADGPLEIEGVQFVNNSALIDGGGAIFTEYTPLIITSTAFTGNMAGTRGGAISVTLPGTLQVMRTQFISNTALGDGGAIAAAAPTTITNSYFEQNATLKPGTDGGAILFDVAASTLLIQGTDFVSNTATRYGGALANRQTAAIRIVGGRFQDNRADLYSGAIDNDGVTGLLEIDSVQFVGNASPLGYAGALWTNAPMLVTDTVFISNSAAFDGGALEIDGPSTLLRTTLISNTAGRDGGGISAFDPLTLIDVDFINNQTARNGGALDAFSGATTTISGGLFMGNQCTISCTLGGGAIMAEAPLVISGTEFVANRSTTLGGSILLSMTEASTLTNVLFARNDAPLGTALYVTGSAQATLVHSTIAGPTIANASAIEVVAGTATITNTIIVSHAIAISNSGGTVAEDNNLFFGNGADRAGVIVPGIDSMVGNPGFVNANVDDYHLSPMSFAIERAVDLGVPIDFEGQVRPQQAAPDIGYDESPYAIIVDVAISKTVTPATAVPGQTVTYTLRFRNNGPQMASAVAITDVVPTQLTNIAVTNSGALITPTIGVTYAWMVADLMPNEGGVVTITAQVPLSATAGVITNTATITAAEDITASNNTAMAPLNVMLPGLNLSDASVLEGNSGTTTMIFTVTLTPAALTTVTASFNTAGNTAIAGSDFLTASGSLTFAPGQTSRQITVTVNGDTVVEPDETLTMTLITALGAAIADGIGVGTIVDDDATPIAGLSISGPLTVTTGVSVTYTASVTAGLGITYAWTVNSTPIGTGNPISYTFANAGTYTVTVTATNALGNISTSVQVIAVSAQRLLYLPMLKK